MDKDILYEIKKIALSEIANEENINSSYILVFNMLESIKNILEERNIELSKDEEKEVVDIINIILDEENIDFNINPEDYINPKKIYGKYQVNEYINELSEKKKNKDYAIDLDDLDDIVFIIKEFGLIDEKIILYELLSDLSYENGNIHKEYEYLSKAWELESRISNRQINYRIAIKLANVCLDLNKYDDAIKLYEIIELNIDKISDKHKLYFYYNYALAYSRDRKYKDSLNIIEKAIDYIDNENESCNEDLIYKIYLLKGLCHHQMRDYLFALDTYNELIDLNSNGYKFKKDYRIYYNIALTYVELNEIDKASEYINIIINLIEENKTSERQYCVNILNLGYLYKKTRNYKKAKEIYMNSLKLSISIDYKENIIKIINHLLELDKEDKINGLIDTIYTAIPMILGELKENTEILLKIIKLYNENKAYDKLDKLMESILNI